MTLKWLELEGFRSYGVAQHLEFNEPLALIWGANSQGKTSVAEALEFLLTGTTVRRELLGGDKGEYDDSLRNAYHPEGDPVRVTAGIHDADGTEHVVERTLDCDYARKQDCTSTLTIDGVECEDIISLGVPLAEPPLQAPVLFQHSVRYALSSRPTDRLTYFKALLEVSDLDTLTASLEAVLSELRHDETEFERKLRVALEDPTFAPHLGELLTVKPTKTGLVAAVSAAVQESLGQLQPDVACPSGFDEPVAALEAAVSERNQQRFDFAAWRPGAAPAPLRQTEVGRINGYLDALGEADAEAERLRTLFEAVLAVPAVAEATEPLDCPVCETPAALTPDRVSELRERVRSASGFAGARSAALSDLRSMAMELRGVETTARSLVPAAGAMSDEDFETVSAVVAAAGAEQTLVAARAAIESLKTGAEHLQTAASEAVKVVEKATGLVTGGSACDVEGVTDALAGVATAMAAAETLREAGVEEAGRVLVPLREELDRREGTSSAAAVLQVAKQVEALLPALRHRYAVGRVRADYTKLLTDVDRAKMAVFNEKFDSMSGEILRWWNLLRPDEPVSFYRAAPRGTGRRFVSMEAKLSSDGQEEVRDALGVFSDSQLNALGVAAFLARAVLQKTPFIVLDDPLQSGDDEHRDTFIDLVVPALLDEGMQVVVLSYDAHFNRLLTNALPLDGFTVTLDEPTSGTVVVKGTDTAQALLQEAKGFLKDAPSSRATGAGKLRTAAERTAKEILVAKRSAAGERASLADYQGWSLDKLVPKVLEHLEDDRERGRWKNISLRLSPGAHDDGPPPRNAFKVVYDHLVTTHRDHVPAAQR